MHIILTGLGSYGDVLPMVGLGRELLRRGHRATLVTNPYFRQVVEKQGLSFEPVSTEADYLALAGNPDLWRPRKGLELIFATSVQLLPVLYAKIDAVVASNDGPVLLVAHPLDLASRIAREALGCSVVTVVLAPMGMMSEANPPRIAGAWTGPGVPGWVFRMQKWLGERLMMDPVVKKPLNAFRSQLGLKPVDRLYPDWWYDTEGVLAMFPEWFGPAQRDWPPGTQTVGFPLWDQSVGELPLPDGATQWLDAGEAPIVFAPGTANREADRFFEAAAGACALLGKRGVLLTRFPEQLPKDLPAGVRHFDFLPLGPLLRRSAALVHHGGIGTCAQGLAAGVPHLVQPMAFDQPDNAAQLERLGVGRTISPSRFKLKTVAQRLGELLSSAATISRCQELARRTAADRGMTPAADAVESIAAGAIEPLVR